MMMFVLILFPVLALTTSSYRDRYFPSVTISSSSVLFSRGGSKVDNDELDAFVERLINEVDSSSSTDQELDDGNLHHTVPASDSSLVSRQQQKQKTTNHDTTKEAGNEIETCTRIPTVDPVPTKTKIKKRKTQKTHKAKKTDTEEKSKKQEESATPKIEINNKNSNITNQTNHKNVNGSESKNNNKQSEKDVLETPRPPPPFYQFLLTKGWLGHVLLMTCVIIGEFFERYIPELYSILLWMFIKLHIYDPNASPLRSTSHTNDDHSAGNQYDGLTVNQQYSAFVDTTTGTAGGIKANKQQRRAADLAATKKLKSLGQPKLAKYQHLSNAFMKRHNLGTYAQEKKLYENVIGESLLELEKADRTYKHNNDSIRTYHDSDDLEEQDDWVVKALTDNGEHHETTNSHNVYHDDEDANEALQLNSPSETNTHTKQSVLEAAAASRTNINTTRYRKKKRNLRPKASDRDGGGGVLGRIRAVGANNIMTSRILGAYPGDALSIQEAANPKGLVDLARKYGYGEWSDDDDNYDDDGGGYSTRKKKKKRRIRKAKRIATRTPNKSKKNDNKNTVEFKFGDDDHNKSGFSISLGIGGKSSSSTRRSRRSRLTTRKRSPKIPSTTGESLSLRNDESKKKAFPTISIDSQNSLVRPPLARLKELDGNKKQTTSTSSFSLPEKRSSPSIRLPMKRTQELKQQLGDSNKKHDNKEQ